MTAHLRIVRAGMSTTIQDAGRYGFQRFGVPVSGALDICSMRAANLLVGNAPDTATLEIFYTGPRFVVEAQSARIAFAGAGEARIKVYAGPMDPIGSTANALQSLHLLKGYSVDVSSIIGSSVLYMAVEGGFDIAPVLGSCSTFVRGRIGGLNGRALQDGDRIPLAANEAGARNEQQLPHGLLAAPRRFRIMAGPQAHYFGADARKRLCDSKYVIGPSSNRMGMRLEGANIPHLAGYDITSEAVAPGSIQIPGTQMPVVLLADRQTTGGYPKIATVISADMAALGRLPIGAKIGFQWVTAEEAGEARRRYGAALANMGTALRPTVPRAEELAASLFNTNLVSGVCYASI